MNAHPGSAVGYSPSLHPKHGSACPDWLMLEALTLSHKKQWWFLQSCTQSIISKKQAGLQKEHNALCHAGAEHTEKTSTMFPCVAFYKKANG